MKISEFKQKMTGQIESESIIYSVSCADCVSYRKDADFSAVIQGLIDGERKEFYTLEYANKFVAEHKKQKPLHNPNISSKTEIVTNNQKHLMMYRSSPYSDDYLEMYSIDGYRIASDKHAYECLICGAIFESKGADCHTVFDTDDPRCKECKHPAKFLSGRLCACLTMEEWDREQDDRAWEEGCFYCKRKFPRYEMFNLRTPHYFRDYDVPDLLSNICGMCSCLRKGKHD